MTNKVTSGVIRADEAAALFGVLASYDALVLAVSGGCDSLALLHLICSWAQRPAIVHVVTVDHALRVEAAAEAALVGNVAQSLSLPHATLVWSGDKPSAGLIAAARDARYERLATYAESLDVQGKVAVVTAHHADDQVETMLMRLARGSGVSGLAGMAPVRLLGRSGRVELVRPFLEIAKDRLQATLKARGIDWTDDPTNRDDRFERVRVRQAIATLAAAGIDLSAACQSAARLRRADAALNAAADQLLAEASQSLPVEAAGVLTMFERAQLTRSPEDIRLRAVAKAIARHGGLTPPPQLGELEDLILELARRPRTRMTLGGCIVSAGPHAIRVYREYGRITHTLPLLPGQTGVWDGRFQIASQSGVGAAGHPPLLIRALGPAGLSQISDQDRDSLPLTAKVAHATPAVFRGETLLFAPYVHKPCAINAAGTANLTITRVEPLVVA